MKDTKPRQIDTSDAQTSNPVEGSCAEPMQVLDASGKNLDSSRDDRRSAEATSVGERDIKPENIVKDLEPYAWLEPGTLVEYQPSALRDRWYAAVVDEPPRMLGLTPVVRLRDIEPAYSGECHPSGPVRTTLAAAACAQLRRRSAEDPPCRWCDASSGKHEKTCPVSFGPVSGYADCGVCRGTGVHPMSGPCDSCVWRRWYAKEKEAGNVRTPEEIEASRASDKATCICAHRFGHFSHCPAKVEDRPSEDPIVNEKGCRITHERWTCSLGTVGCIGQDHTANQEADLRTLLAERRAAAAARNVVMQCPKCKVAMTPAGTVTIGTSAPSNEPRPAEALPPPHPDCTRCDRN